MKTEILKKLAAVSLAGIVAISMAACSSDSDKEDSKRQTDDVFNPSSNVNEDKDESKDDSSIVDTEDSKEDTQSKDDTSGSILYYESSRGCPYSCAYCLSSATHGVRFKSVEQTLEELLTTARAFFQKDALASVIINPTNGRK